MGFVDVKLADVELTKPKFVEPPVGKYQFQLMPGATFRVNEYTGLEELNVSAVIVDEGEFKGKRVFFSYPNPEAIAQDGKPMSWSVQALKKLEVSLGEDALPGEDAATYLNRVAQSPNNLFSASLVEETRKNKETGKREVYIREGETEPRAVFSIFTVGVAA